MDIKWRCKHLRTTMARVPKSPGLYAYGTIEEVHGLEKSRKIIYVGQTDDLYRRLSEHSADREKNPQLRHYLQHTKDDVLCWYCPIDFPKKKRLEIEQEMIEYMAPSMNDKHNPQPTTKKSPRKRG